MPALSSLSAHSPLPVSEANAFAPSTRGHWVLLIALVLSLVLHLLGITGAADWLAEQFRFDEPEAGPPLRTVLRPPPPPVYEALARPPPPKPRPKPKPRSAPPPVVTAPVADDTIPQLAETMPAAAESASPPAAEPVPPSESPVTPTTAVAEAAAPPEVAELPQPLPPRSINTPKRIDLVGELFVGEKDFMVGTGGFRLRHDGNRYEISVLGQPKGLAKLFLHGEFSGVSRGAITPEGLQPSEYAEERGRADKRESTTLDWEAGVIHLRDDKIVPIEPPVYDRLSVILQFYYRPPETNELSMRVAGTRSVDTYIFKRQPDEKLELAFGVIDTHLWRANFDNGDPRIEIWMSPEYRYLPLRVRVHARKEFGGRYATLKINEIRVED